MEGSQPPIANRGLAIEKEVMEMKTVDLVELIVLSPVLVVGLVLATVMDMCVGEFLSWR